MKHLLLAALLAMAANCYAVDPIHSWAFEGNLLDSSGSGNDGTLAGGDATADYIPGAFGFALDLNSDEGVENSAASNLPLLAADQWTMNVWLNFAQAPGALTYFAGFGNHNDFSGAPEHGLSRAFINFGSGYYFWGCNCDGTQPNPDVDTGTAYAADGNWHMYTVVSDGANLSFYTDSVLLGSAPNNLGDSTFTEVAVGNPSVWNSAARGGIDEFAIWNTNLDQSQVNNLFRSNEAIPEPSTIVLTCVGIALMGAYKRVQLS